MQLGSLAAMGVEAREADDDGRANAEESAGWTEAVSAAALAKESTERADELE